MDSISKKCPAPPPCSNLASEHADERIPIGNILIIMNLVYLVQKQTAGNTREELLVELGFKAHHHTSCPDFDPVVRFFMKLERVWHAPVVLAAVRKLEGEGKGEESDDSGSDSEVSFFEF